MKPLLLTLLACLPLFAAEPTDADRLRTLFEEEWEWQLRDDPERATSLGDRRYDDRLTDRSTEAFARRRQHNRETLRRIESIDRTTLGDADRLSYDIFLLQAKESVARDRFAGELVPVNQMGGIYMLLGELAQQMPRESVKDYENFLARLRAYPRAVDDTIELLRRGAISGTTPPREILRTVAENIGNQIVEDPAKSPVITLAFTEFRPAISEADRQRLRKEAIEIVRTQVLPALQKLRTYWNNDYYPRTREAIGWSSVPGGKDWYEVLVRSHTTTERTPDEIHALGHSEVARIRAEMERIRQTTGFKGTFSEFLEFLRKDPQFFYNTREELLVAYRDISKRVDPELTRLFGRLPRLPYGVIPIPSYSEKTQTTAYYNPGSPEAHRPGYYYVNLYNLKSRPKWEMEALSLHEAVPGHHLQIALAQELEGVPAFRRTSDFTAFVEGWALYAESLGPSLGMYSDPYSKFGQLTYEMWRAVRLVVDTGIHSKGWTRQQAIDFFAANSSKPLHDIEVEIDRYIAWPGQALAYKSGELKIKELRAKAERELGEKFDVRAFHDTILGAGAVPLSILEQRVVAWIDGQR